MSINSVNFSNRYFDFDYKDYAYLVNTDVITSNGELIDLSDNIVDFKIFYLYDKFIYPVVKVKFMINKYLALQLKESKKGLKVRLNIKKFKISGEQISDFKIPKLYEFLIKDMVFIPIDMNILPFEKIVNDEKMTAGNNDIPFELELFHKDHLENINKRIVSGALNDTTVKNAIAYILKPYFTDKKIIFNEPNNDKVYEQIIFKNLSLANTIKYLQEVYGVYKSGIRVFFDFDRYYCIANDFMENKVNLSEDIEDYENVIIQVVDKTISSFDTTGSFVDSENLCYKILARNPNYIEFNDTSNRELLGEEIFVVTSNQKERVIKDIVENKFGTSAENTEEIDSKEGRTKYYYNNFDNPYEIETMISKSAKNNLKVVLKLQSIDTSILTMNKKYYITYSNKEYSEFNGVYQLTGYISDFIRNGKYFTNTSFASFDRMTKDFLAYA